MATKQKPKPKPETNGAAERPEPEVLTLGEAAAFLRVSEDGLRLDAEAGRVPTRRVAGEWRFMRAALRDWLSQPESTKKSMRAVIGAFKDDETLEPMMEEIYRQRKRNLI